MYILKFPSHLCKYRSFEHIPFDSSREHNRRMIDDILYHAKQENLDRIMFVADMEKAFDSLEHNFIFSTLTKFGFGQEFIQWVRNFLRNGSSCVMNNGVLTGYFNLEQGARQTG